MNIDFIKWMCEKADNIGYDHEFGKDHIIFGNYAIYNLQDPAFDLNEADWAYVYYPLLLQRAIEGVNKSNGRLDIEQDKSMIRICDNKNSITNRCTLDKYDSIDAAKEAALMWVFEQEKTK